jgi:hypothetical protein
VMKFFEALPPCLGHGGLCNGALLGS